MRNQHPGACLRCGVWVAAGEGHPEAQPSGGWRVRCKGCVNKGHTPATKEERDNAAAANYLRIMRSK